MSGRAFRNIFRSPHYADDILLQMDTIGVGSLFIVSLIGFFSGVVMALQMSRALATYGAQGQIGQIVSITLVRELGPVLASLLVADATPAASPANWAPCASPSRSTPCAPWAPTPFRSW